MSKNRNGSTNLFISVAVGFLLLALVTLPVFAEQTNEIPPEEITSLTPTVLISSYQTVFSHESSESQFHQEELPLNSHLISSVLSYTTLLSDTLTPTATITITPTITPSPTPSFTPTSTPSPHPTVFSFIPFILHEFFVPTNTPTITLTPSPTFTPSPTPPRPEKVLFCDNIVQPIFIPDNFPSGITNDISVTDGRLLAGINLYLDISHTYVGDLEVSLTNLSTGQSITALSRPGNPTGSCANNDITTILGDGAAQPVDDQCALTPRAISGIYLPSEDISTYINQGVSATWRLTVSDHYQNDVGWLNHWCLETLLADAMPVATPTPTPFSFPSSAYVYGMSGQDQQLNLDCESRSAVDWARHFGFNIDELDFLNNLPRSDDPEAGFVGNPDGHWGYIPPNDYGVHALPVSMLLQEYGATASSYHMLRWDDLRAEIVSGNPAIVWIIGGSSYNLVNGIPHLYTAASTREITVVAPYEHTVIIVGYTPTTVTVLNGSRFIDVPIDQFLDSWSVLQFMAVLARP